MRTLISKYPVVLGINLAVALISCSENKTSDDKSFNGREAVAVAAKDSVEISWREIDLNIPDIVYPEITSKATVVRSNGDYSIYSVAENTIFHADTAIFLKIAHNELQQIATSATMRYPGGKMRIYGLAGEENEQRADSLKTWFVRRGGIDSANISIHPVNFKNSISNDKTTLNHPENPRIEIVVIPDAKN